MAILTGNEILKAIEEKHLTIEPYNDKQRQPNSYDVTLSDKIAWLAHRWDGSEILDPEKEDEMVQETIPPEGIVLFPECLYLLRTNEVFWSDKYVSEISGISSLARKGVAVHKTAGYANLGHRFAWVLEVEVTHKILIRPNMRIGQVYFHTTKGDTNMQYEGRYDDQNGETVSAFKSEEEAIVEEPIINSPLYSEDSFNPPFDGEDEDDYASDNSDEDYDGEEEDDSDIPVEDQTDDDDEDEE